MDRIEEAKTLRDKTSVHYNCCQSVVIPFRDLCGLDMETANRMAEHFGGGMRHGSTCGAITGALMVLGLAGAGEKKTRDLLNHFRQTHGALDCAHLLVKAKEEGVEKKCHCDGLVLEAVTVLEALLAEGRCFDI